MEPMDWYAILRETETNPAVPQEVRDAAEAALVYVDRVRAECREQIRANAELRESGGATVNLINGVPADKYGLWCPHGHHIFVVDPVDSSDYPGTIPAEPWPCSEGCTVESVRAMEEEEAARYDAERWEEYWNTQMPPTDYGQVFL